MAFEKTADIKVVATELVKRMNEDIRRIRLLEERVDRIEDRMERVESTALNQLEDLRIKLEGIAGKISKISEGLTSMDNEIIRMNKELGKKASKADIKGLETFIEILNPITSRFVTKDELKRELEGQKKFNIISKEKNIIKG